MDSGARRIDFYAAQQPAAWDAAQQQQTQPQAAWAATAPPTQPRPQPAQPDAEAALRGLEAEWAAKLQAPLAELAGFEAELSHAIETVHAALPPLRRPP